MIECQSLSPSLSSISLLIGLAAMLCAGCATDEARRQAVYARKIQHTEQMLIAAGDADSLAAAAMLSPLEAQLHAVDPDNGAAWFDSIGRAARRNDEAEVRKDLVAIAGSARFDTYWNTTVFHVTQALLRTKTMDSRAAFITATGVAAAVVFPPYQYISNACKGEFLKDPDGVAICRRAASVMSRGDTYLTELIGLAIAKRAWPEGSAEFMDAVNARRVAHYRVHMEGQISLKQLWSSRDMARRLQLMTDNQTEQEVVLAEISSAKLNPNPPADWTE